MDFEEFRARINAECLRQWGLTIEDAGADEDEIRRYLDDHVIHEETIEDIVRTWGEDFDLTLPDPMTAQMLERTAQQYLRDRGLY